MSVNTLATSPIPDTQYRDDEIDLRQSLEALIAWRREIALISLGIAILAAIAIVMSRWLLPPAYEARADVAIVRTVSDVSFDERFTTNADEQTTTSNASARRAALALLVKSDAIAQKVIDQLGDILEPDERDANALVDSLTVVSTGDVANRPTESDLIQMVVRADSPTKAAAIATAWARIFVQEANLIYGQTPNELVASVVAAQQGAKSNYESIQAELVQFLANSRVDELKRQMERKEQVILELRAGEQSALHSLLAQVNEVRRGVSLAYLQAQADSETEVFEARRQAQQELLNSYIDAQYQSQAEVFRQQYLLNQRLLSTYNLTVLRLKTTLSSVQALKQQVEAGDETVDGGTVANLQLLKLQTYTDLLERINSTSNQAQPAFLTPQQTLGTQGSDQPSVSTSIAQPVQVEVLTQDTPLQLQIDLTQAIRKSTALADINALISVIEGRLQELDDQVAQLSEEMVNGDHYDYLQQRVNEESVLAEAIRTQEELFKSMSTVQPTSTIQAGTVLTAGISLPFLNSSELQQIATLYGADNSELPTAIEVLESELRQHKSELEAEQSKQRELIQSRDLAWSTFTTVNSKVEELMVSQAAAGSEVRFAAEAVPPVEPVKGLSLILTTLAGAFAGLILATLYALVASSIGRRPFLARTGG